MKWLAGVVLALSMSTAGATEYGMKYLEHAIFFTATQGKSAGKVVCLENKTEEQTGLVKGWKIMTCNNIDTPKSWTVCYVNAEKKSFICGVKPS